MVKTLSLILLWFSISTAIPAQDTTSFSFTTTYQGKNYYVQNPFYNDTLFCTCQININHQKQMGYVASSSYEIDLSSFKIGDTLNLQIVHYKSCRPKLLNPYTGHSRPLIYKTFTSWGNTLIWTTYNMKGKGVFSVEHFEYNSWETKYEINSTPEDTLYTYDVHPFSGINKYRLKYEVENGEISYSMIREIDFDIEKLNVDLDKEKRTINFSREAEYSILSEKGEIVLQGYSTQQDLSKLKEGIYYLNADNKTKKIKIRN